MKSVIIGTALLITVAGCSKKKEQKPHLEPVMKTTDFSKPFTPHPEPRPDYIGIKKRR